jgi:hypothetical protein
MSDIAVIRGDDVTLNITVTDDSTTPATAIDITGATIFFTVKANLNDADADALISKSVSSHSNPAAGITSIALTPTDTDITEGLYPCDFQVVRGGKVSSSQRAVFEVAQDVTIRTT